MFYLLIFMVLLITELVCFQVARYFNIIDKPNLRSSHTQITLRGGGIIFPVSVLLFYFLNQFQYPWFVLGMTAIALISFADDLKAQSRKLRLLIHAIAVVLLLYQARFFQQNWCWWPIGFVTIVAAINACNFMDGINGMTTGYAFTALASLFLINRQAPVLNEQLLLLLALGNGVFAFFNFRKKASCFAGDVGSISMAFCLLFCTLVFLLKTGSFLMILLFAVYGIDSGLTILHRLYKGENIIQPHRQHLYQYLANEKKWPHLAVSSLYMLIQALVDAGILYFYRKSSSQQLLYALFVCLLLVMIYWRVKQQILQKIN